MLKLLQENVTMLKTKLPFKTYLEEVDPTVLLNMTFFMILLHLMLI